MKSQNTPIGQKRQAKEQRRQERRRKQRVNPKLKAVRAEKEAKPQAKAGGYLMQEFWKKMNVEKVLTGLGQVKLKGLPLSTLFLVLMLFGVVDAKSDSDLSSKVKADPLLGAMWGVEALDKQQI